MARRIEQIQRNRKSRRTKENILFEFEGRNKTEEIYFRNYQKRDNPYNLKFAYGNDTDPVSMVKSLISYIKKEDISVENDDKIYCVFDADIDVSKQKKIDEAKKLALENGIEVIISIPSFELWYRLHYSYTSKVYASNKELLEDIRNFIPNYEKGINVYDNIKEKTQEAIYNGKRLEEEQIKAGKKIINVDCNPYTAVYKPVEYILNRKK